MASCERCWQNRHCRGRNGCSCSVCADQKMRPRLTPKVKPYVDGIQGEPRRRKKSVTSVVTKPDQADSVRKQVVAIDPVMEAVIVEALREGHGVWHVVNHTNFTFRQVEAVQAKVDRG